MLRRWFGRRKRDQALGFGVGAVGCSEEAKKGVGLWGLGENWTFISG